MVTYVIIEDHEVVRLAVRHRLDQVEWLSCVGEASDGPDGLALLRELVPDAAVVDIRLPGLDGIEIVHAATRLALPTKIVLNSAFASPSVVHAARAAGAAGIVEKGGAPGDLVDALRAACGVA